MLLIFSQWVKGFLPSIIANISQRRSIWTSDWFPNCFGRYKLHTVIIHNESHFTATLIDRSDRLHVFDIQIGIWAVRCSTHQIDGAMYSRIDKIWISDSYLFSDPLIGNCTHTEKSFNEHEFDSSRHKCLIHISFICTQKSYWKYILIIIRSYFTLPLHW
jgi:hypothetical protein